MANEDSGTTLLDAPAEKTTTGADATKDGSLLDTKPAESSDGKTAQPAAPPKTDSDKTPPADPQKPTDKAATGAPEKYADFKLPDGMTVNAPALEKFNAECKTLNLSQENHDKLLAIQAELTQTQIKETMDAFHKQISDWSEETKRELGADPAKSLSVASKAIDTIFTDPKENQEFREMMKSTGLGNWRLMVKAFSYVGKAISEDHFVDGRPGNATPKTLAERIYGDSAAK